eukprot:6171606-Amphidinium_carterae.1
MTGHPASPGTGHGSHGGTAIAVRRHIGITPDLRVPTGCLRGRMSSAKIGGIIRGGLHVISVYLEAGVPVRKQLPYLHELAGYIRSLQHPWICLGDFNCTPAELHSTGWLDCVSGTLVTQNFPTCSSGRSRILDYGVIATSIRHRVQSVELLELSQVCTSPHRPVIVRITGRRPHDHLLVKRMFRKFPTEMPIGPVRQIPHPTWEVGLEHASLHEAWTEWSSKAELWLLCALDQTIPDRMQPRKLATRSVSHAEFYDVVQHQRSTAESRAWNTLSICIHRAWTTRKILGAACVNLSRLRRHEPHLQPLVLVGVAWTLEDLQSALQDSSEE